MVNWKKIKKYSWKAISTFVAANAMYFGLLIGGSTICTSLSPRIHNQSELEQILTVERKRAGIKDYAHIRTRLDYKKKSNSGTYLEGEVDYFINLCPLLSNTLFNLRHELYHIADGQVNESYDTPNKIMRWIKRWYLYEPQASIYAATGLKL